MFLEKRNSRIFNSMLSDILKEKCVDERTEQFRSKKDRVRMVSQLTLWSYSYYLSASNLVCVS